MVPPVPPMPMMPVMPMMPYAVDMPLLPPTPPFMMQQFGPRRPSSQQRSHSSSPTIGNRVLGNHSSDRVNVQSSSQPSSPNHHHRGHERRASGDVAELHKSRRMTGSPAQSQSHSQAHPHAHDRRSVSSSSHRPQPPSGMSGSSSSRKVDSSSSSHRDHRTSSRPPNIPRNNTTPIPVPPILASVPYATPTPVLTTSWTQPAFQNLSRPSANRRQTMIS